MGQEVDKNIEIMKLNNLLIMGAVAVFMSCGSEKLKLELFRVEEARIGYQYLLNQNFQKSEVDAMMFEKSFNDTLIYYEYTEDLKRLYSKTWRFPFEKFNKEELEKFLKENNVFLMVPDDFSLIDPNTIFCVMNYSNNLIYFCSTDVVDEKNMINIVYYFPF
ncbi:hypothetical protein [Algoriphagus sp. AGSA1]|uniref:hypothetical protein n=1 Tax=Algoriphagus sp. AGSA1 TaxID=2907213 RepID=UPI001F47A7D2|nr:hypothetical protein [Algoriphagus sp. AGSA1]